MLVLMFVSEVRPAFVVEFMCPHVGIMFVLEVGRRASLASLASLGVRFHCGEEIKNKTT